MRRGILHATASAPRIHRAGVVSGISTGATLRRRPAFDLGRFLLSGSEWLPSCYEVGLELDDALAITSRLSGHLVDTGFTRGAASRR